MSARKVVLRARKRLLNDGDGLSYFKDRGLTRDTISGAFVGYEPEVYFSGNNGQGYKGPALLYPCIGGSRVMAVHYKSLERGERGKRYQKWGGYADDLPPRGHGKRPGAPAKIVPFGLETLKGLEPGSLVVLCCGEEDALSLRQIGFTALSQPGAGLLEPVYAADLRGFEVVVFYDAGEEAEARKDALKVLQAGAAEVRLAEWPPDAPHGTDINGRLIENG
jgi:hypothetical protein